MTFTAEFSLETMRRFIDWNRASPYKVERGEDRDMNPVAVTPEIDAEAVAAEFEASWRPSRSSGCSTPSARATTSPARSRKRARRCRPTSRPRLIPRRASSTSTPTSSSQRPTRPATGSPITWDRVRPVPQHLPLRAGREVRRRLWKRRSRCLLRAPQGRADARALSSVDCWLAGVRREDSANRAKTLKFALDKRFGLWKLNPLADWTEADVWNYIHEHDLPVQPPLHDQGYPSIGCTHCTKPVGPGGSPREGRWAGLAEDGVQDRAPLRRFICNPCFPSRPIGREFFDERDDDRALPDT